MPYSTCARVVALIPNLTNGATTFDNWAATIVPGSAAYVAWMSSGCAMMQATLQARGYDIPASTGTTMSDLLANIEANYAAYMGEAARGSPRIAMGERVKADVHRRIFEDGMKFLREADLSPLITQTHRAYVGGVDVDEITTVDDDTDIPKHRFARDAFKHPDS